jgi:hypothetical protein
MLARRSCERCSVQVGIAGQDFSITGVAPVITKPRETDCIGCALRPLLRLFPTLPGLLFWYESVRSVSKCTLPVVHPDNLIRVCS